MKVKELTEELQKCNPESEVKFSSCVRDNKKFTEYAPVSIDLMYGDCDGFNIYLGKTKKKEKKKTNI